MLGRRCCSVCKVTRGATRTETIVSQHITHYGTGSVKAPVLFGLQKKAGRDKKRKRRETYIRRYGTGSVKAPVLFGLQKKRRKNKKTKQVIT